MHVEEDPRVGEVLGVLPGANCGACGYAGCADYAKAIVEGAPVNKCVPGGCKMCGRGCSHHGRGSGRSCEAQGYRSSARAATTTRRISMSTKALKAVPPAPRCIPAAPPVNTAVWATGTVSGLQVRRHHGVKRACPCESGKMHRLRRLRAGVPQKVIWIRPESEKPVVMCANHGPRRPDAQGLHGRLHRLHEVRKELPGGRHQGDQ